MKKINYLLTLLLVAMSIISMGQNIIITEISYNPPESGSDSTEYIELYNKTSSTIDLSGYTFTSGVVYTFPNGVTLAPKSYIVTGKDSIAIMNRFNTRDVRQWRSGGLSNGGEPIVLKTSSINGATVDSLRYDDVSPWPIGTSELPDPDGDGSSIVLCDYDSDNVNGTTWTESANSTEVVVNSRSVYGSPGSKDPACNLLHVFANIKPSNTINVYPNPTTKDVTLELNEINNTSVKVFSPQGDLIFEDNNIQSQLYKFNLTEEKGLFLIQVTTNGVKTYQKVIKE